MNAIKMTDQSIVFDESIISKIEELIKMGLAKLKSFVKSDIDDLTFYYDLKNRFDEIAFKLEELQLWHELKYFISISHYIEYIVYQNSIDSSFGHCSFAVDLLNFYIDFITSNFDFYLNPNDIGSDKYDEFQKESKLKHRFFRRKFYGEIYELSGDYAIDDLYEVHEALRE